MMIEIFDSKMIPQAVWWCYEYNSSLGVNLKVKTCDDEIISETFLGENTK